MISWRKVLRLLLLHLAHVTPQTTQLQCQECIEIFPTDGQEDSTLVGNYRDHFFQYINIDKAKSPPKNGHNSIIYHESFDYSFIYHEILFSITFPGPSCIFHIQDFPFNTKKYAIQILIYDIIKG